MSSPLNAFTQYTEPVSEGEEDEDMALGIASIEGASARVPLTEALEAIAFRERKLQAEEAEMERQHQERVARAQAQAQRNGGAHHDDDDADERTPFLKKSRDDQQRGQRRGDTGHSRRLAIDPLAPSSEFDKTFRKRLDASKRRKRGSRSTSHDNRHRHPTLAEGDEDEEDGAEPSTSARPEEERVYLNSYTAQTGKRISVPVRVEPKVFFAQERTFLVMLEFLSACHSF